MRVVKNQKHFGLPDCLSKHAGDIRKQSHFGKHADPCSACDGRELFLDSVRGLIVPIETLESTRTFCHDSCVCLQQQVLSDRWEVGVMGTMWQVSDRDG